MYESSFDLMSDSDDPYGMTTYENRFYVTDNDDDKVSIYSTNGVYEYSFDLTSDSDNPVDIITYNNKFYICDTTDNKVYIYPFD